MNHTSIQHLLDEDQKEQSINTSSATITKEGEPIQISVENQPQEELEPMEHEPIHEKKETEPTIELKQEEITLHPDLKKAGLQTIDSSSIDPKQKIQLPLTDERIMEGLHQPVTSSFRWLAEFALFLLKQAHLTLKVVHGHVVRVLKR